MKHSVEEVRLKNGARGLLIDIPGATTMNMKFQFRAGDRYAKSKDIAQVAHLMEHMAFGANAKYKDQHDYDAEFTKNGAYYNAHTGDISMMYEVDCADFEWERIMDLQKLAICQPRFNEEDLESEKSNVRSELTNLLDDHYWIMIPPVRQAMGEDILNVRQWIATIGNIDIADIREHHRRTHTTDNMRFIITGKLFGRKSEIKRQLEEMKLPRGERFNAPIEELHSAGPVLVRRKSASSLTFGLYIAINRRLSEDEISAMRHLNHILTGTMYSRIFGAARKCGLAYEVSSHTGAELNNSSWDIFGQVNHSEAGKLCDLIAQELKNIANGKIKQSEVEAAKSFALGRYQMGAQTVSQISNFYTQDYFNVDHVRNYHKMPSIINKITLDLMVKVAKEYIENGAWVLAAVSNGDKEELVELNSKFEDLFGTKGD